MYNFVSTVTFAMSTLVGVFVVTCGAFDTEASTFMGISVHIFVCTRMCIFVSTFVKELAGQTSRLACAVLV